MYVCMCVRCEWFFKCAMRALVGFRSVGWSVRCRHLSEGRANQHYGNEPISALGIEPISGWHTWHGSCYISSGFCSGIQTMIVTDQVITKLTAFLYRVAASLSLVFKAHLASPRKCALMIVCVAVCLCCCKHVVWLLCACWLSKHCINNKEVHIISTMEVQDLVCPVPCIVCYVNRSLRKFFMCVLGWTRINSVSSQDGLVIC